MVCFVNFSAFVFQGINPSYLTPSTISLQDTTIKKDALGYSLVSKHRSMTGQTKRKSILSGELKSVQIQEALPEGLKPELMPKHVAIIKDGHRRWANERGLTMQLGHTTGGRVIKEKVFLCCKWGIKVLSVFAFSTENWGRPKEEVDFLMNLFEEEIRTDLQEFTRKNVRISVIGDKSKLPKSLQESIATAEDTTRGNTGLHLMMALNYSGRYDIMKASRSIASKVKDGFLQVEDINETLFQNELETKCVEFPNPDLLQNELETKCVEFPNPDLLIRTSGEQRISNFFLWQLAYSEVYFPEKKFPDFKEKDFKEALSSFQKRKRRYGGNE
ncbi:dehydrodolichyl diphosphate synthase 2-like [Olea europaea var. sylvestris]|uniref:dehydrodolichyl diphosphate synthase 2-like n=1 Tax=Olea europaea var. sylvestris TaxID=158386 RepID=UPI000C1D6E74|nr:dehydrodolichyl diphosphate synthase 2-like [Olea europaea var. sylvestris]